MIRIYILLLATILFSSCSEYFITEDDNTQVKLDQFEAVWQTVDQEYPFLEFKNIDWDALYDVYKSQVLASQGDEYYDVLIALLAELKDGHVAFGLKSGSVRTYYTRRELKDQNSYSPELVRSYFNEELVLLGNGKINYGILEDNIGYIRIKTWEEDDGRWIFDIDKDISCFKRCKWFNYRCEAQWRWRSLYKRLCNQKIS